MDKLLTVATYVVTILFTLLLLTLAAVGAWRFLFVAPTVWALAQFLLGAVPVAAALVIWNWRRLDEGDGR